MLAHVLPSLDRPERVFAAFGLDAGALLALGFDTIELRSRAFSPLRIRLGPASGPVDPSMEELLRRVQPVITISGRLGRFQVAPYGVPVDGIDPAFITAGKQLGIGLGAVLLGLLTLYLAK